MDEVTAWQETRQRVCALVSSLADGQLEHSVPATPDWTGRQLLAHMVGLGADVLAGDEPDDHNDTWTQRQVDARADRTPAELVAEWDALAEDLMTWMRDHGTRPLGDVVIHEQDLRGAVGLPGGGDGEAFAAVRDRMLDRFAVRVGDLAPIALVGDAWSWVSRGEVDDASVVVRATDFNVARALMSRRTAEQLRSWTVRGDVEPYLPCFEVLGPLPRAVLPE